MLPHSGAEVPLTFSPSALGLGSHQAQITFASKEVIETFITSSHSITEAVDTDRLGAPFT